MTNIEALIYSEAVLTLAVIDRSEDAAPLANALLEGGLTTIEVALRTDESLRAIRLIADQEPNITILAGTVLSVDHADQAVGAGAKCLVSPGFSSDVSRWCSAREVTYIPGVASASEIMVAIDHGHRLLKFFPAAQLGGLDMLEALHAPFASQGISFLLTGGMNQIDLESALRVPYVAAVGGSWIASRSRISDKAWEAISISAQLARDFATQIRTTGVNA